jgi:hypothetical protein
MKSAFRILHLEDSPDDCELVRQLLVSDGIDCETIRCGHPDNTRSRGVSGPPEEGRLN